MEKKKININQITEDAGKGMKSLFGKAKDTIVKVVDQNEDGTFDKEDVSAIVDSVSDAAKNTVVAVKDTLEEQRKELERKTLQPIFIEDLDNANFNISKLIRITDIDKKRAESEVCQGSIGYYSIYKDLKIINIYRDYIHLFGLEIYPDLDSEIYYVDPSDRDRYIAMEKYFNYLKIARITELKKLAQDLGAKYFRVIYKEKEAKYSSKLFNQTAKVKVNGDNGDASIKLESTVNSIATFEIVAENEFEGHEPAEPKLRYLQRDLTVQNLIAMRLDTNSKMKSEKFIIEFSDSVGIKVNDAVKIDGALKAMKVASTTSVTSEVKNESRKFFEYEIKF